MWLALRGREHLVSMDTCELIVNAICAALLCLFVPTTGARSASLACGSDSGDGGGDSVDGSHTQTSSDSDGVGPLENL